jgi:hypothetical protein
MFNDIAKWTVVSSVFAAAFGIAFTSVADPHASSSSSQSPHTLSLWTMLGYFDYQEVKEWNELLGPPLLWIYAFVSTLVLVNLLIAMMSDSASLHSPRPRALTPLLRRT